MSWPGSSRQTWSRYLIGVAPGEPSQPVAVSVVEQVIGHGRGLRTETDQFRQSHLEQIPGGSSLPEVARRIGDLYDVTAARDERLKPQLVVDVSSAGTILPTLLDRRFPVGIAISAGIEAKPLERGGGWGVPRHELGATLLLAFQTGRFVTARTLPLADAFASALQAFTFRPPTKGTDDELDLMRRTAADQLVIAAALCVWQAGRGPPPSPHEPKVERRVYDPFKDMEG